MQDIVGSTIDSHVNTATNYFYFKQKTEKTRYDIYRIGTPTPANLNSDNSSWAHKHVEKTCFPDTTNTDTGTCTNIVRHEYDNAQMFHKFVSAVNNQSNYNNDGKVRAIPIIVYHILVNYPDLSDRNRPIDITVNLFDAEMRYLYDNGFKVITMSDLGYDENTKSWKNLQLSSRT